MTGTPTECIAAYICPECECEGRDPEAAPFVVYCWNCGARATVTCRLPADWVQKPPSVA